MSTRGTLSTISSTLKKQLAIASVGVAATALILLFIVRQKWPSPASRFAPTASKDIKRQLASGGVYLMIFYDFGNEHNNKVSSCFHGEGHDKNRFLHISEAEQVHVIVGGQIMMISFDQLRLKHCSSY